MATQQELQTKLDELRDSLDSVPDEFKADIQAEIDETQAQLDAMQSSGQSQPPAVGQSDDEFLNAMMATLSTFMASDQNSGIDSPTVRAMIKEYLQADKVKLDELDKSVLEEIKKNQTVILEIPAFGKKIEINQRLSKIPNFFEIIDDVLAGNNVYLIGEAGGGKAGSLNSKILTENGWKTYATIEVGDKVWGEDGNLYEVSGVFDRGYKPVYTVHTNDGGCTETCDEHLWKIYTRNDRHRNNTGRVIPLSELKDNLFTKQGNANAFIDVAKAIPFREQNHVIDPYLMGVLIGDGSITQKSITISKDSEELFESLVLPKGVHLSKRNTEKKCLTYGIAMDEEAEINVVTKELQRVELFGNKSINKFIPKEYLYDSIKNRISLLQGLNDTDGYCDETHFEFSTSSEQLAADYCELVRSLGGTAKSVSRIPTYIYKGERKVGNISFRIHCVFPENIIPFRLSHKLVKYQAPTKYKGCRYISSVKFKGIEPVRCISVTNPSRLYITDDYIVTHNTFIAETIATTLQREYVTLNCSQYTSPLEILGGQSIEGFKQGKLIDCWKNGKILIMDEMPKLDANTAGLFNDALAKSSKTRNSSAAKINSANPEEPPIERNDLFGVIATGNIYPNQPPAAQYRGNNQQDLSLLDRFSGSVYYTEFNKNTDEDTTRFKFLYDFLVGNYYEYIEAKMSGGALPEPKGLRTVIESLNAKNLALVSYRTNISFRVGFEYQLVREIARSQGKNVEELGKTLLGTFKSYMVAFTRGTDIYNNIIRTTKYTDAYITNLANDAIKQIMSGEEGFKNSLNESLRDTAAPILGRYKDFFVAETVLVDTKTGS